MKHASSILFNGGFVLILFALPTTATASIIAGNITAETGGLGSFVQLFPTISFPSNPANTIDQNNFQSQNLFAFSETQNIVLAAPLSVDMGGGAAHIIPAGTIVASHYVFFDPASSQSMRGSVLFDSEVLAVITSTNRLAASDAALGLSGINYLNPGARGLEAADNVALNGPNGIRFDITSSAPGDYFRVLTEFSPAAVPTPEPSTFALFGIALAGCIGCWLFRGRAFASARFA